MLFLDNMLTRHFFISKLNRINSRSWASRYKATNPLYILELKINISVPFFFGKRKCNKTCAATKQIRLVEGIYSSTEFVEIFQDSAARPPDVLKFDADRIKTHPFDPQTLCSGFPRMKCKAELVRI